MSDRDFPGKRVEAIVGFGIILIILATLFHPLVVFDR